MKNNLAITAGALLTLHVLVWGAVGYLIGGWETARNFGLITGPIFALFNFIPFFTRARKARPNRSQ